jgi:glycosyltransferase involved in cell wall biosynthesis
MKSREDLPEGIALPAVAVAVCNYNQAQYVTEAIGSVLKQTYPNIELIVVDDCSTDDSVTRIEAAIAKIDGNVTFIRRTENGGQLAAMLSALDNSNAPFVLWLDADDLLAPNSIDVHVRFHLNSLTDCAMTSANVAIVDVRGNLLSGATPALADSATHRKKHEVETVSALFDDRGPVQGYLLPKSYRHWAWSSTSGMMFRRVAIELIRPRNPEDIKISADNYLARFCHVIGGSIIIREVLAYQRIHGGNKFSKFQIVGDRVQNVPDLRNLIDCMNYQFANVLLNEPQIISKCFRPRDIFKLVKGISTSRRTFDVLMRNSALKERLSIGQNAVLRFRSRKLH